MTVRSGATDVVVEVVGGSVVAVVVVATEVVVVVVSSGGPDALPAYYRDQRTRLSTDRLAGGNKAVNNSSKAME